uniref:Putative conserved plasma membrane protein n=2 Tax=Culex tarsalis TaxID=7177 RepID=A0A1Q3FTF4_CULTA
MIISVRFLTVQIYRLHRFMAENYHKILFLNLTLAAITGTIHWLLLNHPTFLDQLRENLRNYPLGVIFGVTTVALISCLLLYALHRESTQKTLIRSRSAIRLKYIDFILLCLSTGLREATERHLRPGTSRVDQLDSFHVAVETCLDRFREDARRLFHGLGCSRYATLQQLEEHFRIDQRRPDGGWIGEEILKLKRSSKSLLSEKALKTLLTK